MFFDLIQTDTEKSCTHHLRIVSDYCSAAEEKLFFVVVVLFFNNNKMKPYLNKKYDQEIEVCDSSKLLKQILGHKVPEGVL